MAEYIEREALYEKAYWHGEHPDVGNPFPDGVDAIDIKDVDAIPAADVAPVRYGRWTECVVSAPDYYGLVFGWKCSECGYYFEDRSKHSKTPKFMKYCPNCGTKMDLE